MTPNLGQGGNQAIESAAVLVSCLVDFLRGREEDVGEKGKFGERGVEEVLREYQDLRKERTRRFVNVSGLVTRNEALETLKHVLRFLYTEPLSGEALAGELFLSFLFHFSFRFGDWSIESMKDNTC